MATLLGDDGQPLDGEDVAVRGNSLFVPDDDDEYTPHNHGLSSSEKSSNSTTDAGASAPPSAASPSLSDSRERQPVAKAKRYMWQADAESTTPASFEVLLQRKAQLKEMDLADHDEARAEWFALIAALDRKLPAMARARAREAYDQAERDRRKESKVREQEEKRARKQAAKDEKQAAKDAKRGASQNGKSGAKQVRMFSIDVKVEDRLGMVTTDGEPSRYLSCVAFRCEGGLSSRLSPSSAQACIIPLFSGPVLAVGGVDKGGAMFAAGLQKGDRIMSVDGTYTALLFIE